MDITELSKSTHTIHRLKLKSPGGVLWEGGEPDLLYQISRSTGRGHKTLRTRTGLDWDPRLRQNSGHEVVRRRTETNQWNLRYSSKINWWPTQRMPDIHQRGCNHWGTSRRHKQPKPRYKGQRRNGFEKRYNTSRFKSGGGRPRAARKETSAQPRPAPVRAGSVHCSSDGVGRATSC